MSLWIYKYRFDYFMQENQNEVTKYCVKKKLKRQAGLNQNHVFKGNSGEIVASSASASVTNRHAERCFLTM